MKRTLLRNLFLIKHEIPIEEAMSNYFMQKRKCTFTYLVVLGLIYSVIYVQSMMDKGDIYLSYFYAGNIALHAGAAVAKKNLNKHHDFLLGFLRIANAIIFFAFNTDTTYASSNTSSTTITPQSQSFAYFKFLPSLFLALSIDEQTFVVELCSIVIQIGVILISLRQSVLSVIIFLLFFGIIGIQRHEEMKIIYEIFKSRHGHKYWQEFIWSTYPVSLIQTRYHPSRDYLEIFNFNQETMRQFPNIEDNLAIYYLDKITIDLQSSKHSLKDETGTNIDLTKYLIQRHQQLIQRWKNGAPDDQGSQFTSEMDQEMGFEQSSSKYFKRVLSESNSEVCDVLVGKKNWETQEGETVIIRVFEVEQWNQLVVSIEEYPVKNESFLTMKKKNKKLVQIMNSTVKNFQDKFQKFWVYHQKLQGDINLLEKEDQLSFRQRTQQQQQPSSQSSIQSNMSQQRKRLAAATSGQTNSSLLLNEVKRIVSTLILESVVNENRIYCIEQYLQICVKRIQPKIQLVSIQLDRFLENLQNFFPQLKVKKNIGSDTTMSTDLLKLQYLLISIISNAVAVSDKKFNVQLTVSQASSHATYDTNFLSQRFRTSENIQESKITNSTMNQINKSLIVNGLVPSGNVHVSQTVAGEEEEDSRRRNSPYFASTQARSSNYQKQLKQIPEFEKDLFTKSHKNYYANNESDNNNQNHNNSSSNNNNNHNNHINIINNNDNNNIPDVISQDDILNRNQGQKLDFNEGLNKKGLQKSIRLSMEGRAQDILRPTQEGPRPHKISQDVPLRQKNYSQEQTHRMPRNSLEAPKNLLQQFSQLSPQNSRKQCNTSQQEVQQSTQLHSNWEGVNFRISLHHYANQPLTQRYNFSDDPDSTKLEQKIINRFVKLLGPQPELLISSTKPNKVNDIPNKVSHNYQTMYSQAYESLNDQQNSQRRNPPRNSLIITNFEFTIYKNADILNNPSFVKPRPSHSGHTKKQVMMMRIPSDDIIPRVKTVSSVINNNTTPAQYAQTINDLTQTMNPQQNQQVDPNSNNFNNNQRSHSQPRYNNKTEPIPVNVKYNESLKEKQRLSVLEYEDGTSNNREDFKEGKMLDELEEGDKSTVPPSLMWTEKNNLSLSHHPFQHTQLRNHLFFKDENPRRQFNQQLQQQQQYHAGNEPNSPLGAAAAAVGGLELTNLKFDDSSQTTSFLFSPHQHQSTNLLISSPHNSRSKRV